MMVSVGRLDCHLSHPSLDTSYAGYVYLGNGACMKDIISIIIFVDLAGCVDWTGGQVQLIL